MHDPSDLELRHLLRAHIASYEELDALLLLHRAEGRTTVAAIAEELKLQSHDVKQILDRLLAARLIRVDTVGAVTTFRCEPAADLAQAVNRLAELDAANRVRVVELMTETAIERLRARTTHAFERFSSERAKKGR